MPYVYIAFLATMDDFRKKPHKNLWLVPGSGESPARCSFHLDFERFAINRVSIINRHGFKYGADFGLFLGTLHKDITAVGHSGGEGFEPPEPFDQHLISVQGGLAGKGQKVRMTIHSLCSLSIRYTDSSKRPGILVADFHSPLCCHLVCLRAVARRQGRAELHSLPLPYCSRADR